LCFLFFIHCITNLQNTLLVQSTLLRALLHDVIFWSTYSINQYLPQVLTNSQLSTRTPKQNIFPARFPTLFQPKKKRRSELFRARIASLFISQSHSPSNQ
jgi:hypothetical protein